jgi:hypothetical protein
MAGRHAVYISRRVDRHHLPVVTPVLAHGRSCSERQAGGRRTSHKISHACMLVPTRGDAALFLETRSASSTKTRDTKQSPAYLQPKKTSPARCGACMGGATWGHRPVAADARPKTLFYQILYRSPIGTEGLSVPLSLDCSSPPKGSAHNLFLLADIAGLSSASKPSKCSSGVDTMAIPCRASDGTAQALLTSPG